MKKLATVRVGNGQLVQGYLVDSWFKKDKEGKVYIQAKVAVGPEETFIGELIE